MAERRMPFGKYKGFGMSALPDEYLQWVYAQEWLRDPLKGWVEEEFERRQPIITPGGPIPVRGKELVEAGFKALARLHHPDVGGTNEAMRESLEARAWLMQIVSNGW